MTHLIFAMLLNQDASPDAGTVVSKMIAKYHDAKTIAGDYSSVVVFGRDRIEIKTDFQIERPKKIYLKQTIVNGNRSFLLTSDGKEFSYAKPVSTPSSDPYKAARLYEDVQSETSLGDIIRASAQSVAERSAVLDLLVGDIAELKYLRGQWQTFENTGLVDLDGEKVYRIVGKWRLDAKSASTANYGMFITESGDLRKYVIDGTFSIENAIEDAPPQEIHVSREFRVNAKVGVEVEAKLFNVIKS